MPQSLKRVPARVDERQGAVPLNGIEQLFSQSKTFETFASGYFAYLGTLLKALNLANVGALLREIENARTEDKTVFIIGNGGSAATASHMANDLSVGTTRAGLDGTPFRVVSLTDNVALMTAAGNDLGYKEIFVAQLRALFKKGDRLIAISASGKSPNILEAADWVRRQDGRVISLVGFDGGRLKELSDVCIHVETANGEYGPVEDVHMILDHVIYSWLRLKIVSGGYETKKKLSKF
jgi:D-sedoheptulose 7-phosphate isomerase